jgi:hypothetical protein
MLSIAKDIGAAEHSRCYGLPQLSLKHQVLREIEAAREEGRELIGNYPSEEEKTLSKGLIAFKAFSS